MTSTHDTEREKPLKAGDPCPVCQRPVVVRQRMFAWRGELFSGLTCEVCHALWDNPADSFLARVGGRKP